MLTQRALVLETHPSSRATFRRMLVDLGIKTAHIDATDNLEDAVEVFNHHRPRLVFADYVKQKKSGFDLFRVVKDHYPNRIDTALFMSADESGPYLLNRIEDEEVDAFIPRPFTYNTLEQRVIDIINSKLFVPPYDRLLSEARMYIKSGQYQDAIPLLIRAKLQYKDSKEAWALEGRILQKQNHYQDALACFKKAVELGDSYYPGVAGLFDLQLACRDYVGAEATLERLLGNFTLRPKKLPDFIRFAVTQKRFDEIIAYYDMYTRLDEVDDEIAHAMAAALVVAGKHFVTIQRNELGLSCLKKAVQMSLTKPTFLKEAIIFLLNRGFVNDARQALSISPDHVKNSREIRLAELEYLDNSGSADAPKLVEISTNFLKDGLYDPLVYIVLIKRSVEMKRRIGIIREVIDEACQRFPDMREIFQNLGQKKAS